jgi:hypothetical protein
MTKKGPRPWRDPSRYLVTRPGSGPVRHLIVTLTGVEAIPLATT